MKIKKFNEDFNIKMNGISNYAKPITVKDMKDYLNDLPDDMVIELYNERIEI